MIEAQTGTNCSGDHIHPNILPTALTGTAPCKVCADNANNRVCNTGNQFLRMEIITERLFRATARHSLVNYIHDKGSDHESNRYSNGHINPKMTH
jgi:hypothetical protein